MQVRCGRYAYTHRWFIAFASEPYYGDQWMYVDRKNLGRIWHIMKELYHGRQR